MDINTIRGLATLVALIAFLSVAFWAYSSKRRNDFEEAASLPFADEPAEGAGNAKRTNTDNNPLVKEEKNNNE